MTVKTLVMVEWLVNWKGCCFAVCCTLYNSEHHGVTNSLFKEYDCDTMSVRHSVALTSLSEHGWVKWELPVTENGCYESIENRSMFSSNARTLTCFVRAAYFETASVITYNIFLVKN